MGKIQKFNGCLKVQPCFDCDFSQLFTIFRDCLENENPSLKTMTDFVCFVQILCNFLRLFEAFWDFSILFETFPDFWPLTFDDWLNPKWKYSLYVYLANWKGLLLLYEISQRSFMEKYFKKKFLKCSPSLGEAKKKGNEYGFPLVKVWVVCIISDVKYNQVQFVSAE